MTAPARILTAEDLERMPEDGFRYELVRGELRKMSPSGYSHGEIVVRVTWRLAQHVEANRLGSTAGAETGFRLSTDPDTVRAPDVAFVSRERLDAAGPVEGFYPGAPDLAVEVVSPSDTYAEVEEKVADWLDAGTRMVVVVNPRQRRVTVHRPPAQVMVLAAADVLDGGEVVPGWVLPIAHVFS